MILSKILGITNAVAATTTQSGATQAAQHPQGGFLSMIWLPLLLIIIVYFLLIRPQSRRNKEHRSLLEKLTVGDEIMTAGGILAKVIRLRDNFIVVQIGKDVEIAIQKSSISSVLPKGTIDSIN